MNDRERAEIYLNLYRQQMERYGRTQDVEWKANSGVWTLLAGAIYLAAKDIVAISRCLAAVILIGLVAVHCAWLLAMHRSENFDKGLWVQYRSKALRLADPDYHGPDNFRRDWREELIWLLLEVGVTIMLSVVLFSMLFCRFKS
jgi:hypothetical protein